MSDMDDMRNDRTGDQGCEEYADDLAALALGALGGRQRARILTHVESCPGCADELEHMARLSDTLVQVAPEIEPPLGFETRLFERMGVAPPAPARRRRMRRWVPATAAAVAVAASLAVGLGLSLPSSTAPTVTAQGGAHAVRLVSAPLLEHGRTVGRVAIDGANRWMSMMLADSSVRGTVDCVVVTRDGASRTSGSAWSADTGTRGHGDTGTGAAYVGPIPLPGATRARRRAAGSPPGRPIDVAPCRPGCARGPGIPARASPLMSPRVSCQRPRA